VFCSQYARPFYTSDGAGELRGGAESRARTGKQLQQLYSADRVQRVEAITPEHTAVQAILDEFPAKRPVGL
jgi:hypothetical protein